MRAVEIKGDGIIRSFGGVFPDRDVPDEHEDRSHWDLLAYLGYVTKKAGPHKRKPQFPGWQIRLDFDEQRSRRVVRRLVIEPTWKWTPEHGLQQQHLKAISLLAIQQELDALLTDIEQKDPTALEYVPRWLRWYRRTGRRAKVTERELAQYAEAFVDSGGDEASIAERFETNRRHVKYCIEKARSVQILTKPGRGSKGGVLTSKGRALIKDSDPFIYGWPRHALR